MRSKLGCDIVSVNWPLLETMHIARSVITDSVTIVVTLRDAEGRRGRGEASGRDYAGETQATMTAQVRAVAEQLHDDLTHEALQQLLPAGGARNALDCALWDLRAKQAGVSVAQLLGLPPPAPVLTAFTIGIGDADETRRRIRAARHYPLIKVKVNAQWHVQALDILRTEHPDCRVVVDANGGWTRPLLESLLPSLQSFGVELIEQPVPPGEDHTLAGLQSPIPLAADESCDATADVTRLAGLYQAVNIKLDKCGGLSEAMRMQAEARRLSLTTMVGNMCGSSLAMAPAFLVAQGCGYTDLDGPLLQREDMAPRIRYDNGWMQPPVPELWG